MGFSDRRFLIGADDSLYRLPTATFDRMLQDPARHGLPRFAGQRVRMADLIVEVADRQPRRVVHSTFAMLAFDDEGCLDQRRFDRQQRALATTALAPVFGTQGRDEGVVDAAHRFVAQGGVWVPSQALARSLEAAALGLLGSRRL